MAVREKAGGALRSAWCCDGGGENVGVGVLLETRDMGALVEVVEAALGCKTPSAVASLLVKEDIAQPAQDDESVPGVPIRGTAEEVLASPRELEGRVEGTIGVLSGRVVACLRILLRYTSKVLLDVSRTILGDGLATLIT